MSQALSDKTITLISGANQGVGLAAATALARDHGHHVIIGSRKPEAGSKVAESLTAQGYAASSVQLDLDSEASIKAAVEEIEKTFGRLDVLINNAGILIDLTPAAENMYGLFTKTFTTNVIGTAFLTENCVPMLRKSSLPRIVFVSSRMGSLSQATDTTTSFYSYDCKAYDASKAAVNMLALQYARILEAEGARVNVACPGLVATNLHPAVASGATPEVGATRIVQLATLEKDGPNRTYSDKDGPVPW